ncbi:YceI family protein [Candidatus Leptofilum sp.]|uniref:YceI family protein n=1 Tax=Candidatus Leptofilum sp. TaxID=3241576 RepID=UPI003B5BD9A1
MYKNIFKALLLFAVMLLVSACGLLQEPEAPSATIEAIPLEIEEAEEEVEVEEPTAEAEQPPVEIEEADEPEEMDEAEELEEEVEEPPVEEEEAPAAGGLLIFDISQDASEVRFELDEDLRGSRFTVVGSTNQVAGQLALDFNDLSTAQVGEIRINARTLETDNDFRNRAIQNEILDTGDYEFISFVPTAVSGLPESAAIGEEISFTIEGDLTIRDVTEAVTFNVVATAVSETEISGTATATVLRDTYGLTIPEVPNVANVENEVDLIINFVANAS